MLSRTLGANLVGNIQAGKSLVRERYVNKEKGVKQGDKMVRTVYSSTIDF